MTLTVEIPEDLARNLGADAAQMTREALGIAALRQGLWTEAQLAAFLGLSRLALDQFLKDHGVELEYGWADLERERQTQRDIHAQ